MKRILKWLAWIVGFIACILLLSKYVKGNPDLGQRMLEAGANTLVGMGIVFLVLIFISLLISCFKFISIYENRMKKDQTPENTPKVEIEEEEDFADDLELVAVITAAIAASTGSSPSGLVVRSIKRAPANKWKKA